jgi:hypothetical protein
MEDVQYVDFFSLNAVNNEMSMPLALTANKDVTQIRANADGLSLCVYRGKMLDAVFQISTISVRMGGAVVLGISFPNGV